MTHDSDSLMMRDATAADIPALAAFIFTQGADPLNHLPEEGVRAHVEEIRAGTVRAVVGEVRGRMVAVVTYQMGYFYDAYQPRGQEGQSHGYLAEAAVDPACRGRGWGSDVCRAATGKLLALGVPVVYAKRHAENERSGGMMAHAGLRPVATFKDPEIRTTGNRRTTVERLVAHIRGPMEASSFGMLFHPSSDLETWFTGGFYNCLTQGLTEQLQKDVRDLTRAVPLLLSHVSDEFRAQLPAFCERLRLRLSYEKDERHACIREFLEAVERGMNGEMGEQAA